MMLTEDEIDVLKDKSQSLINSANQYAIQEICRILTQAGSFTSSAEYKLWQAQKMGLEYEVLIKEIAKRLSAEEQEIKEMHEHVAKALYDSDVPDFIKRTIPFEKNTSLQQIIKASAEIAGRDYTNLTKTIGMVAPDGKELPLKTFYQKTIDWAFTQVSTGMLDHNTAIRLASRALSAKGLTTIDYQSGVITSLEAAVRRNVMGGLGLLVENVTKHNHESMKATGWEMSAHTCSAPDHEDFQGKQYTNEQWEVLNGTTEKLGTLKRRVGTLNCGHIAFPIIIGVNKPQYTDKELSELQLENAKGIEYNGKHFTGYETKQRQRELERKIRVHKKRLYAAQGTNDKEWEQQEQIKLARLRQEYTQFSKAAGLRTQEDRLKTVKFGREKQTNNENNGKLSAIGLIKVTEENIRYISIPKSKIWGSDGDKVLLENSKELLISVQNKPIGTEHATLLSIKTKNVLQKYQGDAGKRSVGISEQKEPFYMLHNHPSGMTFSPEDIDGFNNIDNLKGLIAVGNNGNGYLIEKLKDYNKEGYLDLYKSTVKKYGLRGLENRLAIIQEMKKEAYKYGVYFAEE